MRYFLLGHFCCGMAASVVFQTLYPRFGNDPANWSLFLGFLGTFIVVPQFEQSWLRVNDALKTGRIPRMTVFACGLFGTAIANVLAIFIWRLLPEWINQTMIAYGLAWIIGVGFGMWLLFSHRDLAGAAQGESAKD